MKNILSEIIAAKHKEVEHRKSLYPVALLEKSLFFNNPCVSMKDYLLRDDKEGIIAEIKRKSPSKGIINDTIDVEELSIGYMQAGASALSVLTDNEYFGGKKEDLMIARKYNYCPILRKDFMVDEYQLFEARSWGADTILLIAAALEAEKVHQLADKAKQLGMEVLLEVHSTEEVEKCYDDSIDIIGVNNRDLKTFETSIKHSIEISKSIPKDAIKISESGIETAEDIQELRSHGFKGFLIGETFMKNSQPATACARLIGQLSKAKNNVEA